MLHRECILYKPPHGRFEQKFEPFIFAITSIMLLNDVDDNKSAACVVVFTVLLIALKQ